MVKYSSFHSSSFALRELFNVNGHSVTHSLFIWSKMDIINLIIRVDGEWA
jgi:hypothetical protein